jgi:hypothetical protein
MHNLCARTASNAIPLPMHNRKAAQIPIHFLLDLGGNLSLGVGDLDSQLLGTSDDVNSLSGRDVVGDLGRMRPVVHEEEVNVVFVVDEESLVAGGSHVTGLLVGSVADRGHGNGATESTSDTTVDTLGLTP